jgi:hypothetical protein
MARVFISYKRADKEKVFRLKEKIEAATGESCWIDLERIECDTMFTDVIIRAIEEAEIFLFMYSNAHTKIEDYKVDYTIREINYALAEGKRIVFVNIDKTPLTKWFKFMFGPQQQIDATSEESFGKLLEDLKEWLGVKEEPEAVEMSAPVEQKMPGPKAKPESVASPVIKQPVTKQEPVAKEAYTVGLKYELDDTKLTAIVEGIGTTKGDTINIPPVVSHNGKRYSVTIIGMGAFEKCKSITSISIPSSVSVIRGHAFKGCSSLKSINIPNSVTSIGMNAFSNCISLTSVSIPKSVTKIGLAVFDGCSCLSRIVVESGNRNYDSRHDCNGIIETSTNKLIAGCQSTNIPDGITAIESWAFAGCSNLKYISLPSSSLTQIGHHAFAGCISLHYIFIQNGVQIIGKNAFEGCKSLTSIHTPKSVQIIEHNAFEGCVSLNSAEIWIKTKIRRNAFPKTCKVKRIWFG